MTLLLLACVFNEAAPMQYLEPGFARPDAALIAEKTEVVADDDLARVADAYFIRGHAVIPVRDGPITSWGMGLWVKVTQAQHQREMQAGDAEFEPFDAVVANQVGVLGPLLGRACRVSFAGSGQRPKVTLTEPRTPLTRLQREGLSADDFQRAHDLIRDPYSVPLGALRVGSMAHDGFSFINTEAANLAQNVPIGNYVKVAMHVEGATPKGDTMRHRTGMWVEVLDVSNDKLLGGRIASNPRIPMPFTLGWPIWVPRSSVYETKGPDAL